jgi:KTSC domain-containing protein
MAMQWTDTPNSSNVARVGFDPDTQDGTVEFRSGGTYLIPGAGEAVMADMAADPSPGGYYHRHIRNRYPVRKL